ncbi:histidine ammonia-lyase [Sulfobacillus thermosulfidooxidans]|uniref:histidine ammonia-lyase n=1 Tax=Sulfobacillus thermosulfidooxidans TaxID=28034 RepID=UPI000402E14D|nr:histidine ammonia-lyase [Sulfobacillus thermosulfidooxidans]
METVILTGDDLDIEQAYHVAHDHYPVALSEEAANKMAASRAMVTRYLAEGKSVYGVTTGFGRFSDVLIPEDKRQELQINLLRSHSAGVGEPFGEEIVRGMMVLRANALAKGYSGIRESVVRLLIDMLNRGVVPVIPSQGSVGASGDLAPLAHLALVLIGEGWAQVHGGPKIPGGQALKSVGLEPVILEAKEGLGLINGTQAMGSLGVSASTQAKFLGLWADVAASLSIEALRGIPMAFHPQVALVRPHPGQRIVQQHLRTMLEGSHLVTEPGELRMQDAYSLRATPQVHGACLDALGHVQEVLSREINSATDNPLLFPEEELVISAGNFHGEPLALVLDYLAILAAEWANISERRIERMVNPALSGLPPFLTRHGGVFSGLMLAQYTAASLVSENKVWAHPSSVDSIPTSANQEDHVSMGTTAGRKALMVVNNLRYVLSIELLCGAQACDLLGPEHMAPRTHAVYQWIRQLVPPLEADRPLAPDIERIAEALLVSDTINWLENLLMA